MSSLKKAGIVLAGLFGVLTVYNVINLISLLHNPNHNFAILFFGAGSIACLYGMADMIVKVVYMKS